MQRFMLKSKIHRAKLTGTDLNYEGSITMDKSFLEKAKDFKTKMVLVNGDNEPRE